jgi:peptidyl-tRNA hydrolase, PTH1 family
MIRGIFNIFAKTKSSTTKESIPPEMKYLIAGLGNIGSEYAHTRHNIGFDILEEFARSEKISFDDQRYGAVAEYRYKGRLFILLKPSTYVNLSGKAVAYWMQKEKISAENLLVVVDDLALDFGTLRVKSKGSDAGHNGLKSIQTVLGHNQYARLRFGIGDNFIRGHQANYVLSPWDTNEKVKLPERIDKAVEIIKSFGTIGTQQTMNLYNNK